MAFRLARYLPPFRLAHGFARFCASWGGQSRQQWNGGRFVQRKRLQCVRSGERHRRRHRHRHRHVEQCGRSEHNPVQRPRPCRQLGPRRHGPGRDRPRVSRTSVARAAKNTAPLPRRSDPPRPHRLAAAATHSRFFPGARPRAAPRSQRNLPPARPVGCRASAGIGETRRRSLNRPPKQVRARYAAHTRSPPHQNLDTVVWCRRDHSRHQLADTCNRKWDQDRRPAHARTARVFPIARCQPVSSTERAVVIRFLESNSKANHELRVTVVAAVQL